jgi:hypothetical protein
MFAVAWVCFPGISVRVYPFLVLGKSTDKHRQTQTNIKKQLQTPTSKQPYCLIQITNRQARSQIVLCMYARRCLRLLSRAFPCLSVLIFWLEKA